LCRAFSRAALPRIGSAADAAPLSRKILAAPFGFR
jgi:hypothetical protein